MIALHRLRYLLSQFKQINVAYGVIGTPVQIGGELLPHADLLPHRHSISCLLQGLPADTGRFILARLNAAAQQETALTGTADHRRITLAIKGNPVGSGTVPVRHPRLGRSKHPMLHSDFLLHQNAPCPIQDRGRKLAVPPLLCRPLAETASGSPQQDPGAVLGAPVQPYWGNPVQAAAPRGIRQRPLSPFHQNGGSLGRKPVATGPHPRITRIISQDARLVKSFSGKQQSSLSAALLFLASQA